MKNLETLEKLISNSIKINNSIDLYQNTYKMDEKHYDKIGFHFNGDNRFKACNGLNLYVSSWKGVYGNSNCGTILDLDEGIFNNHLLKVLNKEFFSIMQKVSESIAKEAKTFKEEAKKELQDKLDKLKSLDEIKETA